MTKRPPPSRRRVHVAGRGSRGPLGMSRSSWSTRSATKNASRSGPRGSTPTVVTACGQTRSSATAPIGPTRASELSPKQRPAVRRRNHESSSQLLKEPSWATPICARSTRGDRLPDRVENRRSGLRAPVASLSPDLGVPIAMDLRVATSGEPTGSRAAALQRGRPPTRLARLLLAPRHLRRRRPRGSVRRLHLR